MALQRNSTISFADAVRSQSKSGGNSYSVTNNPDGTVNIIRTTQAGVSTTVARVFYQPGGEAHTDSNLGGDQVIVFDAGGNGQASADATIFLNSLT